MVSPMKTALLILALLAPYREDTQSDRLEAHRAAIAKAVAEESLSAPVPTRQWVALMLAIGWHESGLSIRISDGKCKPYECDQGRAKGMWQVHRNTLNRDSWALQDGDVALQAKIASDALRRAYWTCARSGVEFPRGALNAYAGRRCGDDWPGLKARLATYQRLR